MSSLFFKRNSSWRLRQLVNLSVFLPMISVLILFVIAQFIFSFQQGRRDIQANAEFIAQSISGELANRLWYLETEHIQDMVTEIVTLGKVAGATVTDNDDIKISFGTTAGSQTIVHWEFDLFQPDTPSKRPIGKLIVYADNNQSIGDVIERSLQTLLFGCSLILLATFFVKRILTRHVIAPMEGISTALSSVTDATDIDTLETTIALQEGTHATELVNLETSIKSMTARLRTADTENFSRGNRLVKYADLVGLGYCIVNLYSHRITECDANFARFWGKTSEEFLAVSNWRDHTHNTLDETQRVNSEKVFTRLARGETVTTTAKVELSNERAHYLDLVFTPIVDANGGICCAEIIAYDFSDIHNLEENLLQAQKTAAIGKLTGGVAHDFNNLLAVISGNLELMMLETDKPELREHIKTSLSAVRQGANLTAQLLAFARKQALSPVTLDPNKLLRQLEPMLRTLVGEGIDLELVLAGGTWLVNADPTQLETSIINLVANARDAVGDNGKITVETMFTRLDRDYTQMHPDTAPGQYVTITVSDTGTGMPADVLSKAIDPFFTTKEVGKGTGLGLSMVYGFAKQTGGNLTLYSEVGRGTTAKMYLPRVMSTPEQTTTVAVKKTTKLPKIKILIVEDNKDLIKIFSNRLRKLGATVFEALDGQSALEILRHESGFDLLLTDVILPGDLNGKRLATLVVEGFPDIKVIYMSGFTENAIVHHGRLDEGSILLQKPFSVDELIATIQDVVFPKNPN